MSGPRDPAAALPADRSPAPAAREMDSLAAALADRYAVQRELGRGGMATVYLARDVRHDRLVALKVLNPELGAVLGVERFLAEIRVTATLQHPNLLPLFDSGEAAGLLFYVMPYVEGETLRHRLEREKQLPVDEAVRLAVAVAQALDYAHRHGVIHRDLKPENILLQAGQPVVADFGIALAVSNAGGQRVTQTGLSLGTPQYMSPEQATGDRVIDGRTDIYSLGAVLYELLAGDPPHTASTVQAVVAKVLTEKPPGVRVHRETVPAHVEAALERALAKLPADRFATAHHFAEALEGRGTVRAADATNAGEPLIRGSRRHAWRDRVRDPWMLAALAIGLAASVAATWGWTVAASRQDPRVGRFRITLPAGQTIPRVSDPLAISPDGGTIAYVGQGEKRQLYVRRLDDLQPRPLPGTEDASGPFFSPDGRWLGFWRVSTLQKVSLVDGGPPTQIADLSVSTMGAAWTLDDVIIVGSSTGLLRVPASGGTVERLTSVDDARQENGHVYPILFPDGRTVAFTAFLFGSSSNEIAVTSLDEPAITRLGVVGAKAIGFLEGRLLVGRNDGSIVAVPLDGRRLRGPPVPVLQGALHMNSGVVADVSRDGSLTYLLGSNESELVLLDERGGRLGALVDARIQDHPRVSPDGRRVAIGVTAGGTDIWLRDLSSGVLSRLTTQANAIRPAWTPDGRRVAYIVERSGDPSEVWWVPVDGSGPGERLHAHPTPIREIAFSPDGRLAVFRADGGSETQRDLWLLPLTGERKATPLVASPFNQLMPAISPDGKWLAYISDETGQYEVNVRPFPGPGGRTQVSAGGGTEPAWAPDGRRLFYRTANRLVAVTLTATPELSVARRDTLFADGYRRVLLAPREYDVMPDGRRFLFMQPSMTESELVVVTNWARELRALTTAAK